jgi:gamma-glutamyltranspeptidase/glutathione hydrolase
MNRRTFLHVAGTASASAAWTLAATGPSRSVAEEPSGGPAGKEKAMQIKESLLENRNENRSTVVCRNGIVCASQPLATLAGIDVLKAGGNAIDAAIATNAMLSVVEPMNCGPGGDLFAIVWIEKDQKLYGLNASGRSPYDWGLDAARKLDLQSISAYSPLAWNVPGCISGWEALLRRFGTSSLDRLVEPAIRYARDGFPVSPIIAHDWPFDAQKFPTLAEVFMPGGRAPRFGDVFTNPFLADFYETLAREGARAFYEGDIAERIVKFSQANGGRFSMRDFQDHQATWVEPAGTTYRGYDVWEIPPNGQGISALQILNMLEQFDIASLDPNSAEHLHLFIEAKKLAFEDRAIYYADMEFAEVPVAWLISKEYGKQRAQLIDPRRAANKVLPGKQETSETIYLTAADRDGNMVSLIQSTYHGWGSHIVPDRLGFAIQNRGMSFALDPDHRNKLEPHKRPFHTIIPAFVTQNGRPAFSFGVMGGDFQPQGHAQVLMNLIDFRMSPQQAGEQPRVEHSGSSTPTGQLMRGGGAVTLERRIPDSVRQQLAAMGHHVSDKPDVFGGYQGIWREENPRRYFGGTDPRKDGCAIGY